METLTATLEACGARYLVIGGQAVRLHGLPSFDETFNRSVVLPDEEGHPVRCVCAADLLASKLAANRPGDQQDIVFLRELLAPGK